MHLKIDEGIQKKSLHNLGIKCCGSQKDKKHILENSLESGLVYTK
jgi:hypothetical protein